jgi:hypothetical protein
MNTKQENPLAKLQQRAKANPIILTAKSTIESEKLEAVTPVITLDHFYETPRELACATKGDVTKHVPSLATKIRYVGTVSKSIREKSFAELVGGTRAEVYGRKAKLNSAKTDWERDEQGNIVYEENETELMQFFITWDVNRNSPQYSRSREVGINLVPGAGVPKKANSFVNNEGKTVNRPVPDWNAMPELQADITGPIRNCEESLETCRNGDAKTPMGTFVGLIRETPQKEQTQATPTGLAGALADAGIKKDQGTFNQ